MIDASLKCVRLVPYYQHNQEALYFNSEYTNTRHKLCKHGS